MRRYRRLMALSLVFLLLISGTAAYAIGNSVVLVRTTPAPSPTAEPTAADAIVMVYHVRSDGQLLDTETMTISAGSYQVASPKAFASCVLAEGQPSSVIVTVDQNGVANPAEVTFTYTLLPTEATVRVTCVTEGGVTLQTRTVYIPVNDTGVISAPDISGYDLISQGSVSVRVDGYGNAVPERVTFTYRRIPDSVDVRVRYFLTDGTEIGSTVQAVARGTSQTFAANPPAGYRLAPSVQAPVTVTVDSHGQADRTEVVFTVERIPVDATVTVLHRDTSGSLIESESLIVPAGGKIVVTPRSFSGYALAEDQASQVEVSADTEGNAAPASVTFVYLLLPDNAVVQVRCVDENDALIQSRTVTIPRGGMETIIADEIDDYLLTSQSQVTVRVSSLGVPSDSEVVFTYRTLPRSATVMVRYQLASGQDYRSYSVTLNRGDTRLIQAEVPSGYRLVEGEAAEVTVEMNELGEVSHEEVCFTIERIPQNGVVTVYYCDLRGNLLTTQSVAVTGGQVNTITPDADFIPQGYTADGVASQTVTVDTNGAADPSQVYFLLPRGDDPTETPIPDAAGTLVQRWATTNTKNVNLRRSANKNSAQLGSIAREGVYVWVIDMVNGDGDGWIWYHVIYNGQEGYIRSDKLTILSQAKSDNALPGYTPVPTVTPAPSATPEPTDSPQNLGPALVKYDQPLFVTASFSAASAGTLAANQLVTALSQTTGDGAVWSGVQTDDGLLGYVLDNSLTHITEEEAEAIREANATPTPTPYGWPTATPQPEYAQYQGYFKAVGDNVMMRDQPNDRSVIRRVLGAGAQVFVAGQIYDTEDGYPWHVVYYDGITGYIRSDMLTEMSESELTGTPTPAAAAATPEPYVDVDNSALSSYGVSQASNGTINVRSQPSADSTIVARILKNTLCLVLGTRQVNGVTWYNIRFTYNDAEKTGWINGNYFRQMTLQEFSDYLNSSAYNQSGGDFSSVEDSNADTWQGSGSSGNTSYATWVPQYATTAPIATATAQPSAGSAVTPTATAVDQPDYVPWAPEDQQDGGQNGDAEAAGVVSPDDDGSGHGPDSGDQDADTSHETPTDEGGASVWPWVLGGVALIGTTLVPLLSGLFG